MDIYIILKYHLQEKKVFLFILNVKKCGWKQCKHFAMGGTE